MAKKKAKLKDEVVARAVPLVWVGVEDTPVRAVNNAICQFHEDTFIVGFGFTNPPIIAGTKAQVRDQVEGVDVVRVTTVARISLSEAQLEKTIKTLRTNLKRYRDQKDAE